jgi:UDP-3-O-[3-hydroxymyristoyl] glucosamine N-acyltransferase
MSANSIQHTVASIASAIDATIVGLQDSVCTGVSSVREAEAGDITFMIDAKHLKLWVDSRASIGIVQKGADLSGLEDASRTLLIVDRPDVAMAKVLELFKLSSDLPDDGVHDSACIASSVTLGENVRIGPNVVIASGAILGAGVSICSNVRIGKDCRIGSGTILRHGVVIEQQCTIGEDCILYSNVTIGSEGVGYCPDTEWSQLLKLQHIGNVVIGNRVEIGANSCVDRGKFSATKIGNGTKIDNLVQIGHNVVIGDNCVIAAGSGLGGSSTIGNWVQIAAQVGVAPHCTVGDGAKIGAKSGLMHDIPAGEEWLGIPAGKMKEVLRQWASTRKLPGIIATFGRSKE